MPSLESYKRLSREEAIARVGELKAKLGRDLVILGHHYMSDDVIQFADFRGDSLQLSQEAARVEDARYIVFCGVHFMAETADILRRPGQVVVIPDKRAGCLLADMAETDEVRNAWKSLTDLWGDDITPITYVNSTASLKAFCGRNGGIVCTSSNAAEVCRWALERTRHVLFFPDANLGTNTALSMGIPREQIMTWDPSRPLGGNPDIDRARFVVWRGFCYVHSHFTPEHVAAIRAKYEGIRIVVHPECSPEVVELSDENGSTSYIVRVAEKAPAGARLAIGTECNLVYRLAQEHPDKLIVPLVDSYCVSMARINLYNLLRSLESIVEGRPVEVVEVPEQVKAEAQIALQNMLRLSMPPKSAS